MFTHLTLSSAREPYLLSSGVGPLIVSMPHVGVALPPDMHAHMTAAGRAVPDTDWYVDRLYDFMDEFDATLLRAQYSRYLIDLNRPPDDASLYPGMTQTGLCPVLTFAGEPIYRNEAEALPTQEIQRRLHYYWQPYHEALQAAIAATQARHGYALLLDAHSIRSRVPRLFDGGLPHINVGTAEGRACCADLRRLLQSVLAAQKEFTYVFDGRFKGGYITRHYGRPHGNVHVFQIELAQSAYMDESAYVYDADEAAPLRKLLRRLLETVNRFAPPSA